MDHRFQTLREVKRIPGPSLETLWVPAGWGKVVHSTQSSLNLKQSDRHLRKAASHNMTRQLNLKQGLRNMKSLAKISNKAIGLVILEIPHWVNVEAIISIFSRYGSIINVGIDKLAMTAFVDFESYISVQSAIQELNGKIYFGGPLILKERLDKSQVSKSKDNLDLLTLYMSALPQSIKKADLKEGFERFGEIKRIFIGNKGKDMNFAMITFTDTHSSSMAIYFVQSNSMFGLQSLRIDYAYKMKEKNSESNLRQIKDPIIKRPLAKDSALDEITIRLNEWHTV